MNKKGMTLIELIIFIIIGGIFIPLAYIAFTAAVKETSTPENLVKARFIAESKMEDITSKAFDNLPAVNGVYRPVRGDITNNDPVSGICFRFCNVDYDNFQWKWTFSYVAYQDNRVTIPHTTSLSIPTPTNWLTNHDYEPGDYIQPTANFFRCTLRPFVAFSVWQGNRPYNVGDYVVPNAPNGHSYRCVTAGTSDASSEPIWPTVTNSTINDNGVSWKEDTNTATSGGAEPSWASCTPYCDDGSVRWLPSNVYRQIILYVTVPQCGSDACAYKVSTIVTSRIVP
jgi:type II secretory pathway pseudopilin PulG